VRTAFFTAYGAVVGAAFSSLLLHLNPQNQVVATVFGLIASVVCGLAARRLAKDTRMTVVQAFVLIPLTPWAAIGALVGFAAILLLLMVVFPIGAISNITSERRLRRMLNAQGRLLTFDQLCQRLTAGEGTLIEEWGLHGPYRLWWTGDDLLAHGLPPASNETFFAVTDGQGGDWHAASVRAYLDSSAGRASLVLLGFRRAAAVRERFPAAPVVLMVPYCVDVKPPVPISDRTLEDDGSAADEH
jgi:hypothetical protein